MKLNVIALLPLAISLLGSADCSQVGDKNKVLIENIKRCMNFEESLVEALNHPSIVVEHESFDEWSNYIGNDSKKKEREKKFAEPNNFYHLCRDEEEKKLRIDYSKTRPGMSDDLTAIINKQVEVKKQYLKIIMNSLPIVKEIQDKAKKSEGDEDEFNNILKSHIEGFIDWAVEFNLKSFSFSNLHKALESIKGAVEVPRKAKHAAIAVIEALEKNEIKDNLIKVALEGANKSTSSPRVLLTTVVSCSLLAIALLIHNAVTTKPEDDDEEEVGNDEECAAQ